MEKKRDKRNVLKIFVLAFLVMSVVPVCGQSDFDSAPTPAPIGFTFYAVYDWLVDTDNHNLHIGPAAMSGDGNRLIFGGTDATTGDPVLYMVNADGTGLVQINLPDLGGRGIGWVAIDEDGSRGFFQAGILAHNHQLYKVQDSTVTKIFDVADYPEIDRCDHPQTTADGEYVYFVDTDDLWRIRHSGGAPEKVIEDTEVPRVDSKGENAWKVGDFAISADASTIVFRSQGFVDPTNYYGVSSKEELFVLDGSGYRQLTNDIGNVYKTHMDISGDGTTIVFASGGKWYSIRSDGSAKTVLETYGANFGGLDLTYDGTKMFYADSNANGGRLTNTDGSGRLDVFPGWNVAAITLAVTGSASISNDGRRVAFVFQYSSWPFKEALYVGYLNDPDAVSDAPTIHDIAFDPPTMPKDSNARIILTAKISDPQGLADIERTSTDALLDGVLESSTANLPVYFYYDVHDDGSPPDQTADDGVFSTEGQPGGKIDELDWMTVRIGAMDVSKTVVVADTILSIGGITTSTPTPMPTLTGITWDFETGDLMGWTKTGTAFDYQPTYGDNPTARHRGQPSKHQGNYWIGTYEKYPGPDSGFNPGNTQGDGPTGTLTSIPFVINGNKISFLMGGGSGCSANLIIDGAVVLTANGKNTETMERVEWDVSTYNGKKAVIQLVDDKSGGWGHINFDDVRFDVPPTVEGVTPAPTPTSSVTPPEFSGLIFESRSKSSGSTVQIPLTLKGVTEKIGNMDITLSYDPSVLEATEVIKGGLTTTSLFEYNLIDWDTIKISLADKAGFSGDGSIAYVKFNVIGYEGSVSPLEIVSLSANRAGDLAAMDIPTQDGLFTVLSVEECRGDCNGDGRITAADALCALQMAVGKLAEDLVMDMNGDEKVSSIDARKILKISVSTVGEKEGVSDYEKLLTKEFGKLETFDLDGDGSDDRYVYTFETEEVAEDLFLDKSVEFDKTDSGFDGMILLKFENKGDKTVKYSHIEEIPKSFAESVDDLEFSVPPDKLIDPDPKVSWSVKLRKRTISNLVIEATIELGPTALTGTTEQLEEAMRGFVLDHLDDIIFYTELKECEKLKQEGGEIWNLCIMRLMLKYPDRFEEQDCEQIDRYAGGLLHNEVMYAACKAITRDDWRACHDYTETWKGVDICKMLAFNAFKEKCRYITDSQRKTECVYDAAVRADYKDGCKEIADKINEKICFAEITQNKEYCENIKDEEAKKFCCDKLTDPESRKACLAGLGVPAHTPSGTPSGPDVTLFNESDCLTTLPYGFTATDRCYATWTSVEMTPGKGDYAKVHRLYCYYESQETGGKARCELHKFELVEERVKEVFTRGTKQECRWMGGWSKTLADDDDRFVMLCGSGPDDPDFHEIVGSIRYHRSVINIRVESQGSEDIVRSVFDALEKRAKAVLP